MLNYCKLVIICVLGLFLACSMQYADWETWTSEDGKMSIEYPTSWNFNPNFPGVVFSIKTERSGDKDFFREFVTLSTEKVEKKTKAKDYAKSLAEGSGGGFQNVKIVEEGKTKIGKNKAYKVVQSGTQMIFELQWKHTIFIYKEQAYVLSYTAEKANYDKYTKEVERMLNSFTVK